jgi:hypothetical protein
MRSNPTQTVKDALVNTMFTLWFQEHGPYNEPYQHPEEFRKFCEDKFTALFKNLSEIS